jgi:hypothetical protein
MIWHGQENTGQEAQAQVRESGPKEEEALDLETGSAVRGGNEGIVTNAAQAPLQSSQTR